MSSGHISSGTCMCCKPSMLLFVKPTTIPAGTMSPGDAYLSSESMTAVHLNAAPANIHGLRISQNAAALLNASLCWL